MAKKCGMCGRPGATDGHRKRCPIGTKFIKVFKKRPVRKWRLPGRFGRIAGDILKRKVKLVSPNGRSMHVRVIKESGGCSLGRGWGAFLKAHKPSSSIICVFKYHGCSKFEVDVFNRTTGVPLCGTTLGGAEILAEERGTAGEGYQASARRVGRTPNVHSHWEDSGDIEIGGIKLRTLKVFHLKYELRLRGLATNGCKEELIERLGMFILINGERVGDPDIKIELE